MLVNNSSRYKPLFKKYLRLKEKLNKNDIFFKTKLKKKKWKNYINYAQKQTHFSYKYNDWVKYNLSKYTISQKNFFLNTLLNKQRFSLVYGFLKNHYLNKLILKATNHLNTKKFSIKILLLLMLEKQLPVILFRSNFSKSIKESKLLISHNHIKVNGFVIKKPYTNLKKGDTITVSKNINKFVKNNIVISNIWPLPGKYLFINYKLLEITMLKNLTYNINQLNNLDYFTHFNFWVDVSLVINRVK
jgi:ribosomal protein S4